MKKTNNGFTLIELLVVIAIIGILASVVLASLSSARSKGNDAKVKGQLASIRNAAELYYGNNNGYGTTVTTCSTGMFTDASSSMSNLVSSSNYPSGTSLACYANSTAYTVSASLSDGTYWCVDSNGSSKSRSTAVTSAGGC